MRRWSSEPNSEIIMKEKTTLIPRVVIESKGKLSYSESSQAWSIIRFKQELIKEFPQLREKRSKLSYNLNYCRNYEEFEKLTRQLIKNREALPILLFLRKEIN